jgi:hypothetical protein
VCDIALGINRAGLKDFAKRLNASYMSQWAQMGLYEDAEGWGSAFYQVMVNTLKRGGHVHFNLDGVDVADALAGDANEFVGRYTAYELQQIVGNADWFDATTFYLHEKSLTNEELIQVGIRPPTGGVS